MKILSAAVVAIAGLSAMVDCRDDGIRGAPKIGQEGGGHSSVNPNVKLSSDGDQKHDNVLKDSGNAVVRESYIVAFKDKTDFPSKRCEALSKRNGGSSLRVFEHVLNGGCSMMLPEAAANALKKNPNISKVDKDIEISPPDYSIPSSIQDKTTKLFELSSTPSWGLDRINQCGFTPDGIATKLDATGVKMYFIDTGVQADHEDFSGVISDDASCHNDVSSDIEADPLVDDYGHGTHVASTACGNTYGVATNCEVCSIKAYPGLTSHMIGGIDHAIGNCDSSESRRCVINMSLGVGQVYDPINIAVADAVSKNIVVVVAAGNDGVDACGWSPASELAVITVGASTPDDTMASFSNYGSCVDVFAPGSDITAAVSTSTTDTITWSGTSMASPHVAGIAANILRMNPDASPAVVAAKIVDTTSKLDGKEKVATIGCTCSSGTQDATCPPGIKDIVYKRSYNGDCLDVDGNMYPRVSIGQDSTDPDLCAQFCRGTEELDTAGQRGMSVNDNSCDCLYEYGKLPDSVPSNAQIVKGPKGGNRGTGPVNSGGGGGAVCHSLE